MVNSVSRDDVMRPLFSVWEDESSTDSTQTAAVATTTKSQKLSKPPGFDIPPSRRGRN